MTTEPIELTLRIVPVEHGADFTAGMVVGLLRGAGLHVQALDLVHAVELHVVEEPADEPQPEPADPELHAEVERDRLALLARLEREQAAPGPVELTTPPITRRPFDPDATRARAAQGL